MTTKLYFFDKRGDTGVFIIIIIIATINKLISERDFDRCADFWERLALFLFSNSTPYNAQIGGHFRELSAEDVLAILLSENEQYLRTLRRENNG